MKIKNIKNFKTILVLIIVAILVCCGLFYVYKSSSKKHISQNHSVELNDSCYDNFNDKLEDVKLKEKWAQKANNSIYYNDENDFGFILPKEIFDYVRLYRFVSKDGKSFDYKFAYMSKYSDKGDIEYLVSVHVSPRDEVFSGYLKYGKPYEPILTVGDKAYYIDHISGNPTFDGDEEVWNRYSNFFDLDYKKRFFTSKDFKSNNK